MEKMSEKEFDKYLNEITNRDEIQIRALVDSLIVILVNSNIMTLDEFYEIRDKVVKQYIEETKEKYKDIFKNNLGDKDE